MSVYIRNTYNQIMEYTDDLLEFRIVYPDKDKHVWCTSGDYRMENPLASMIHHNLENDELESRVLVMTRSELEAILFLDKL